MNIDITVYLKGFHGDCSATYIVGDATPETAKLREVSEKALMVRSHKTQLHLLIPGLQVGIEAALPNRPIAVIGDAIEAYVKKQGLRVQPDFVGHGIGSVFHTTPCALPSTAPFSQTNRYIFNVKNRFPGVILPGLVFTVEPVICAGSTNFKYVAKCDPRLTLT